MPFSFTRSVTACSSGNVYSILIPKCFSTSSKSLYVSGFKRPVSREKTRKGFPVSEAYWINATSSAPLKAMARSSPNKSRAWERISIVVWSCIFASSASQSTAVSAEAAEARASGARTRDPRTRATGTAREDLFPSDRKSVADGRATDIVAAQRELIVGSDRGGAKEASGGRVASDVRRE